MNIFQDIKTAVKLTREVRKARLTGASGIEVHPVYSVPTVHLDYWVFTMEGCLFYGPKWQPLRDVFNGFPEETQHALTFSPKNGEWADRIHFWQKELRSVLEPRLYHEAMNIMIQHGIRCAKRKAAA